MDFLERIGIKKGYTVLDFGCGVGHYTIPASKLVGNIGMVYATEKSDSAIRALERTVAEEDIKNIELIKDIKDASLRSNSVDVVLCYDVLHYIKYPDRKLVYKVVREILRKNAFFSVYPKHCKENSPSGELADISVEEICKEIENAGFSLNQKITGRLLHDNSFEEGCVFNFLVE